MRDFVYGFNNLGEFFEREGFSRRMIAFSNKSLESLSVHRPTFFHSINVAYLVSEICGVFDFDDEDRSLLVFSAIGHDLGKLKMSRGFLCNSGRLSEAEYNFQKIHPVESCKVFEMAGYGEAGLVCRDHHRHKDKELCYPNIEEPVHPLSEYLALADVLEASSRTDDKFGRGVSRVDKMRLELPYSGDKIDRIFEAGIGGLAA